MTCLEHIITIFSALLCFGRAPELPTQSLQHTCMPTLTEIQRVYEHRPAGFAPLLKLIKKSDIVATFGQFCRTQFEKLENQAQWVNHYQWHPGTQAFMQKHLVSPSARIAVIGDVHGDVDSLLAILRKLSIDGEIDNEFRIIAPNTDILFLGDLADRGPDSIAVWYLAARLMVANPENVYILRGNHEIALINHNSGLKEQVELGYDKPELVTYLQIMYKYLPSALFVQYQDNKSRIHDVLCCHGGIEWGINPRPLLMSSAIYQHIEKVDRSAAPAWLKLQSLAEHWNESWLTPDVDFAHFGLWWSDFEDASNIVSYDPDRGLKANRPLTQAWLDSISTPNHCVEKIVRGHQHGEFCDQLAERHGVYSLWNQMVTTVISCMNIVGPPAEEATTTFVWLAPDMANDTWSINQVIIPTPQ